MLEGYCGCDHVRECQRIFIRLDFLRDVGYVGAERGVNFGRKRENILGVIREDVLKMSQKGIVIQSSILTKKMCFIQT